MTTMQSLQLRAEIPQTRVNRKISNPCWLALPQTTAGHPPCNNVLLLHPLGGHQMSLVLGWSWMLLDPLWGGSKVWKAGEVKAHRAWWIGMSFQFCDKIRTGSNARVFARWVRQERECRHTYTHKSVCQSQPARKGGGGKGAGISAFTKWPLKSKWGQKHTAHKQEWLRNLGSWLLQL